MRDSILMEENQWYAQKDGISSQVRAQILCNYVISGDTVVSDDDFIDIIRRILNSITLSEANDIAKQLFADRGMLCMIYAPENEMLPSKDDILDFWENYESNTELEAYEDVSAENSLMEKPDTKAEIISTNHLETLDTNEYILSNGVRILVKKTDFDKSKIYMSALSQGGASLISDDKYPSCIISPTYALYSGISGMNFMQLQKYLSSKYLGLNISINEHDESIYAQSNPQTLEDMLQLVNRLIAAPQFTDEGWNYACLMSDQQAKINSLQPENQMLTRIRQILYGNSIRHSEINTDFLSKLDKNTSENCFRERFRNAADFTFTFVGNVDEDSLIDLCCYYLGTLPAISDMKETCVYEPFSFPSGITTETVNKGQENKGQVFIAFGGTLPPAQDIYEIRKDIDMINELKSLVEMKLREIIREDMGGTYGVSVTSEIDGYPERYYKFQIIFGCEPSREKELEKEVIATLNKLRTELVDDSYIQKLHEAFRLNIQVNNRNNSWWINMINAVEVLSYLPAEVIYDDTSIRLWVTSESMRDLAKKYLNTDNYVRVFLEPEKF